MKHLCVYLFSTILAAQVADYANNGYKTAEGRERVAKTLNAHDREQTQRPKELVAALGIKPGDTVADIGTGVGYMLPFLNDAVGAKGKLVAEDIFPDFLDKAKSNAAAKGLSNVTFVNGTVKDAQLPEGKVNVALVLDVYHHFDYPVEMLASISKGLARGGRLAIVDFYKEGFRDPKHIRLDEAEVIKEIEANGFKLEKSGPFTEKRQYLAIFRKN